MYNRIRRAIMIIMLMGLGSGLAGCIQPISEVDQTKTVQATLGFSPLTMTTPTSVVPTPAAAPTLDPGGDVAAAPVMQLPEQVAQFVRGRGDAADGLQIWHDAERGFDRFVGFSYSGASGLPCAGFLVLVSANGGWQLTDSGALYCSPTTPVDAFAANTFVLTSDGQPNAIVFGRVEQASVTAVQVGFDDGSNQAASVTSGGFLIIKPGVTSPVTITGADAQGNVILPTIQHSPV